MQQKSKTITRILLAIAIVCLIALLWILRTAPVMHDTIMHFWSNYPVYLVPLAICAVALFALLLIAPDDPETITPLRWIVAAIITLGSLAAVIAFFLLYSAAVGQKVAQDNSFASISGLPAMKSVRTLPYDVMDNMANTGFSSTTEELENGHVVATQDGRLMFTHEVSPSGMLRRRSQQTQGIATQDPMVTERTLKTLKSKTGFPSAPSIKGWFFKPGAWDRAMRVAAYRKHYMVSIKEYTAIATPSGEVLFVAPYTKPKGFLIRRHVPGGVFVAHADGRIEDLTMDEARKRPELASTGRIIPESYIRSIHQNIRYRNGLLNGKFGRKDVYVLPDEDALGNKQPYLTVLADGRPVWVSTAEPKGKSSAAGAVFITDAATARTEIWNPSRGQFVTGPIRALEKIKERPVAGIQWGSQNYVAVEPRPLFIKGQLHYLISITNAEKTGLVKSVIFNAQRDVVVATFDHGTARAKADQALVQYIQTGEDAPMSSNGPSDGPIDSNTEETETPSDDSDLATLTDAERDKVIEQLIKENDEQRELLEKLRR